MYRARDTCPQCGGALERPEADVETNIGVVTTYGPAFCIVCDWAEPAPRVGLDSDWLDPKGEDVPR